MKPTFPPEFMWGTATAAYQIEGATNEGGRGPSIWDTFARTPGAIARDETGDVADAHYYRYRDDVAIMRDLGLGAYRFSLAWPRLQPVGAGLLNREGVDFYDRLLDELHAAEIRPWVTLYHWDLPQPLEDAGGWPARDTAYRFADYAAAVHERFADRVADWTTLNEPWCSAFLGYYNGVHAPGRRDPAASLRAVHHLLLGHGLAVQAMRSARPDHRYGITLNLYPVDVAGDSDADAAAGTAADTAADADADAARRVDGVSNRIFVDALLRGSYPDDVRDDLRQWWPDEAIADGDAELIATPMDVLGVNYYTRHVVRAGAPAGSTVARDCGWIGCDDVDKSDNGLATTSMGWEIDPQGLYDVVTRLTREHSNLPPLYITENGASFDDVVSADGGVHDQERAQYLESHFRTVARAIADGVDVRGYFVWSLLDNFEWSFGYSRRFGIVHVDYDTLERTVKDSGHFLARVAAANGIPAE